VTEVDALLHTRTHHADDRSCRGHALLLCQAAGAVKRSAGSVVDVIVLNTTLVM
jgi:hypothetical protein